MNIHKLIFKIPFIVTVSVIIATISSMIVVSIISSKAKGNGRYSKKWS